MSFALERKLIETAYEVGMPSGSAIAYENVPFTPPAEGFTRISIIGGGEGRFLGLTASDQQRFPGVIDVAIFVRPDVGTGSPRAIADQIAIALANRTLSQGFTTIRTFGAQLDVIGRAGDWHQSNVTIRYERDSL
jgi:hypothetical protein